VKTPARDQRWRKRDGVACCNCDARELGSSLSRVAKPHARLARDAAAEPGVEPNGELSIATEPRGTRRRSIERLDHDFAQHLHRRRFVRIAAASHPIRATGQQEERQQADGPHVRRRSHGPTGLLGSHPERRPDCGRVARMRFRHDLGDAHVENFHREGRAFAMRSRQEHVFGLEIAVHDADGVGIRERVANLAENFGNLAERKGAAPGDVRAQVLALEQLHHEPRHPGGFVDAGGNHLHDVVALDARADLCFLLEPAAHALVSQEVRVHQFQRSIAPRAELMDDVHRSHAPLSERALDAVVRREDGPGL
jgi:hypothetical protein